MARYRLRGATDKTFIVQRKRLGLFWTDYDDPLREAYLIENKMNKVAETLKDLKLKRDEKTKELKTRMGELTQSTSFKETGLSDSWEGGFFPPFRKKIKKPSKDWLSCFPKEEETWEDIVFPGEGDIPYSVKTVLSSTDLGDLPKNKEWSKQEDRGRNNNNQNKQKGNNNQNNRGNRDRFKITE